MSYLYVLGEYETDEQFFVNCAEMIAQRDFIQVDFFKGRRDYGLGSMRSQIRDMLRYIQYTQDQDAYCIIAMDNDRSPEHPHHNTIDNLPKKDQRKSCRFCELTRIVQEVLEEGNGRLPLSVAIAVPVQMLESWLLLICGQDKPLPIFAKKTQPLAKKYYDNKPPDQLKDLKLAQMQMLSVDDQGFILHCLEQLDVNKLAQQSPSFDQFREQVAKW